MGWDVQSLSILRRGLERGHTAGQIARDLGGEFTRNSVLGKIHRLRNRKEPIPADWNLALITFGAAARGRRPQNIKKPVQTHKPKPIKSQLLAEIRADRAAIAATSYGTGVIVKNLSKLSPGQCHWPVGHPGDPNFRYCAAATNGPHASYCTRHHVIAVQTKPRRNKPKEQS